MEMRRYARGVAFVLVAALAASQGLGQSTPVITGVNYENGLTGMAEHAGFNPDGSGGGRHITITLGTPGVEVTEVLFNRSVDVNSAGLEPVVTDRFVIGSNLDRGVDARGNTVPNAIRVEVPPMKWPLDGTGRVWEADLEIRVVAGGLVSDVFPFQYLRAPDVHYPANGSDPYVWSSGSSVVWDTSFMPAASFVEVRYDGPGAGSPYTQTGTGFTVGSFGQYLNVASVPFPTTNPGDVYDVTVTAYPVCSTTPEGATDADKMSTSIYDAASEHNDAGDPIRLYVVHPPATIVDVTETDGASIYYIPIDGGIPVIIVGTNYHNTTGAIPNSGTEVRFDDVPVTVSSYDADEQHMTVTVPPCPEGTERAIKVGVHNFGSSGDESPNIIVYRDFCPTVEMLAPTGGILSGTVRLQADARDDVGLDRIEYWYSTSGTPYMPSGLFYDDGDWDPHADDQWDADDYPSTGDWHLIGTVNAADSTWPYTFDGWTPPDGVGYKITAVAYDDHAATAVNPNLKQAQVADPFVTIDVDSGGGANNPPVVTISSPTDGADIYAQGGNIFLSASATDADSTLTDIEFWFVGQSGDMQPLGLPDPNTTVPPASPETLLWDGYVDIPVNDTYASDGTFYIIAEAITPDGSGYAGVVVNIVSDASTDVSISYITPDESDYAGADAGTPVTVTIYGSGFDDTAGQEVTVYFGGAEAGDPVVDPSGTSLTVTVPHIPDTVPLGSVSVLVEVTDSGGILIDSAERDDLFTVTDSAPSVTIDSPADTVDVGDGVVIVATAIDDKGITQVAFDVDGTPIGVDTTYPFSVVWDMTAVPPSAYDVAHTITATASDTSGGVNTDATDAISVTPRDGSGTPFDNPPLVAISMPANGATVSGDAAPITIVVTTDIGEDLVFDGETLNIIDSGTGEVLENLSATLVDDPGNPELGATSWVWTFTTTWDTTAGLDGSFYLIVATAQDIGLNTGASGVNVTVQNAIPVISPPTGGGGGGCHVGATDGSARTPAAWLLVVFLGAIPFLAARRMRRGRRAVRERAR
jgi:hypothetical protein